MRPRPEIRHDAEGGRFYATLEHGDAVLRYRTADGGRLDFVHTWVPPAHRGERVGEALVLEGLRYARTQDVKVIPTCPFVGTVVRRHPEYRGVLV